VNNAKVVPAPVAAIPSLWTLTVKDGAAIPQPVPFAVVRIDMSLCPDLHVATQTSQKGNGALGVPPGFPAVAGSMNVDASIRSVSTIADASGVARFLIEGAATGNIYSNTPYAAGCARVTADNYDMGFITISALNRDVAAPPLGAASNPVNAGDATVLLSMVLVGQPYKAHADLECDGDSDAADAAVLLVHVVTPAFPGPSNICPPDGTVANTSAGYAW
jgi:hypothetical protein